MVLFGKNIRSKNYMLGDCLDYSIHKVNWKSFPIAYLKFCSVHVVHRIVPYLVVGHLLHLVYQHRQILRNFNRMEITDRLEKFNKNFSINVKYSDVIIKKL